MYDMSSILNVTSFAKENSYTQSEQRIGIKLRHNMFIEILINMYMYLSLLKPSLIVCI